MSYRKHHVKSKIHKIKPQKPIFAKLWFWLVILFVIIILTAGYFLLFYPGFQVKNVLVSGNEKVKNSDLQEVAFNAAHTGLINFWNFKIGSESIFLVNSGKLREEILNKFPIIEKVSVSKNLPQTLELGVAERKPIGVYCDNSNKCFLIDQNGIIFEPLEILPENMSIVRQSFEDRQVFTGENVVQKNIIDAISKVEKILKDNFKIDIKEALVTSPIRLNIKTSENWHIYLDSASDVSGQITKLNLLLNGGMPEDSRKNLYYIDLRPKDRAIFCDNIVCGKQ